jgi:hypothetical protein
MPGIQIIGAGNNISAEVSEDGRLRTRGISIQPEFSVNILNSKAFYIQTTVTPSPSADFLYIKNTDDEPLILENLFVSCSSRENI